MPEITPVELFSVSPAGSVPVGTDQTYDSLPPVAASVWLYVVPVVPEASVLVDMLSGS